jgi:hypothetical protein
MSRETDTTVNDVVQDTVAALDMYQGLYGSGETTIHAVRPEFDSQAHYLPSLVVSLSDGSEYRLKVEQL